MTSTVDNTAPKLLSVSILLRHGARGPGASEMAPFADNTDVKSQWNAAEYEQLTPTGHAMIHDLGGWFAKKYSSQFTVPTVMYRCSKSGRAVESGTDFISGYNAAASQQNLPLSEKPTPFNYTNEKLIDEDYFFRPWKVHKKVADAIKLRANSDPTFIEIAQNNSEFLRELFVLAGAKEEYVRNSLKCFWSCTHLFALLECESYWHAPNERTALSQKIPMEMRTKIEELACVVWSRRFVHPEVDSVLGAPLSVEIFQQSFNGNFNMNIYSAHDYSILSVLGSLGLTDSLPQASQFGCFLLFEVWNKPPGDFPASQELTNVKPANNSVDGVVDGMNGSNGSCDNGHRDHTETCDDNVRINIVHSEDDKIEKEVLATATAINECRHHNNSRNTVTSDNDESNNNNNDDSNIKILNTLISEEKEELTNPVAKKQKILKNNFLLGKDTDDCRVLRILANFCPYEASDNSHKPQSHVMNEKNVCVIAELSVEEVKKKHNFLYDSLTSRGYFAPCQNAV